MPKADSQSFLKYFLINELGNFFYSYSCFIWEVIEGNSGFLKSIPRFLKNMDAFPLTKFLMLKKCNDKIRLNTLGAEYLSIEGVVDYDLLTVNGSTNTVIDIPVDSVAMLRNLTVNFNSSFRRR